MRNGSGAARGLARLERDVEKEIKRMQKLAQRKIGAMEVKAAMAVMPFLGKLQTFQDELALVTSTWRRLLAEGKALAASTRKPKRIEDPQATLWPEEPKAKKGSRVRKDGPEVAAVAKARGVELEPARNAAGEFLRAKDGTAGFVFKRSQGRRKGVRAAARYTVTARELKRLEGAGEAFVVFCVADPDCVLCVPVGELVKRAPELVTEREADGSLKRIHVQFLEDEAGRLTLRKKGAREPEVIDSWRI